MALTRMDPILSQSPLTTDVNDGATLAGPGLGVGSGSVENSVRLAQLGAAGPSSGQSGALASLFAAFDEADEEASRFEFALGERADLRGTYPFGEGDADAQAQLQGFEAIEALLMDREAVFGHLDGLETLLGAGVSLRGALGDHAADFGFAPQVPAITRNLDTHQFTDLLAAGVEMKDIGAGADHGEVTHRLQWYAIMEASRQAAAAETPWARAPRDLYSAMALPTWRRDAGNRSPTIWDDLLDRPIASEIEPDGVRDARSPEWLSGNLRNNTDRFPNLGEALQKRFVKRLEGEDNAGATAAYEEQQRESAGRVEDPSGRWPEGIWWKPGLIPTGT